MRYFFISFTTIFFACFLLTAEVYGQIEEPELREIESPRTPASDGVSNGIGFNVVINNYGFGLGAEYRRVLAPFLEGMVTLRAAGLRDVSEQTFTDIFFGQQIVPNKYKRAFSLPVTLGVRQRIFASSVADNYRFYVSGGVGPVLAFTYPYFDDRNNNGYREGDQFAISYGYFEPVNDVFTGLADGEWHLGLAGELKLNLDIGQNFTRITTIQFGYLFYYFNNGIELMYPNQPDLSGPEPTPDQVASGTYSMEPFFDAQKFFGTPQISFIFGRMW